MSTSKTNGDFALTKENYKIILAGLALIVIGFILMSGGDSKDPNVFVYEEVFSTTRITVAPITCLIGYILIMVGIIKKPSQA